MSTNLEKLLTVQDRDRKIRRLTREVTDIPARKQRIESRLEEHRRVLNQIHEEIKKKNLQAKEIEAEVAAAREKINKLRNQQFEVKSNDDYRSLEKQIAGVNGEISEFEDRELNVMEEIEELKKTAVLHEAELNKEQDMVSKEIESLDQRAKNLESEVEVLKKERESLVAEVNPDWLSRYERILNHTGDYALVRIDTGVCGGCHMKLPPQVTHDARKADTMSLCNYCGRMLYYHG